MSEIGKLSVTVDADTKGLNTGLKKASKDLGSFNSKVSISIKRMAKFGAAAAALGASLAAIKIVRTTREFDGLRASLVTITGDAKKADKAFRSLQEFAKTTPFDLQQSVNTFIKLRNFGLNPSAKAMSSLGNTASALNKTMRQVSEAIADAVNFQFKRLPELGIQYDVMGDKVAFTFQGVRTEVAKTSKDIEKWFHSIGDVNFAGAMAEKAKTLDGVLSNIGDTWDQLFMTISNQGIGEVILDSAKLALSSMDAMIDALESEQVKESFKFFGNYFKTIGDTAKLGLERISKFFGFAGEDWSKTVKDILNDVYVMFQNMPEKVSYSFIQLTTETKFYTKKLGAMFGDLFRKIKNPFHLFRSGLGFTDIYKKEVAELEKERDRLTELNQDRFTKDVESWKFHFKKLKNLELNHIENKKKANKELSTYLEGLGIGGTGAKTPISKEEAKKQKEQQDNLKRIQDMFKTEYQLKEDLHLETMEQIGKFESDKLISAQEANKLKEQEEARHLQAMSGLRESSFNATSRMVGKAYGGQAGMIASAFQDILTSTATYSKKAFEMQKKAAIANAIVNAYEGISKTLSKYPMPIAGVLAAAHAAAGFAQVKAIKSQSFSGGGSSGAVSTGGGSTSIPTTGGGNVPTGESGGSSGGQIFNISLAGDTYGREQVRNLINSINDALSDGAQLNLT